MRRARRPSEIYLTARVKRSVLSRQYLSRLVSPLCQCDVRHLRTL